MDRRKFVVVIEGQGGGAVTPYEDILVNTYGASEVWPLVDIESGTTVLAKVNSARNGSLAGFALQNTPGPVSGTLAPYADGSTCYIDLTSVSHKAIFNGQVGSLVFFLKPDDTVDDYQVYWIKDGSNRIFITRTAATDTFNVNYAAGGTLQTWNYVFSSINWIMLSLTWDLPNDQLRLGFNGVTVDTKTGLGTFSGTPTSMVLAAQNTTPANPYKGWMAYVAVKYGSVWTPTQLEAMYADINP